MDKSERDKRISSCGKKVELIVTETGQLGTRPIYCGIYYGEAPCSKCLDYETYRRRKVVSNLVFSEKILYRAELNEKEWASVSRQLRRKGASGIRVPLDGGMIVVYSTIDPYKKGSVFKIVSKLDALDELGADSNLYGDGKNRSTFGNWALKPKRVDSSKSVNIYILKPSFHPTKEMGGKITAEWASQLYSLHSTTWTKGEVGLHNVQEYFNHMINKAIEMAILKHARWDMDGSKLMKWTITEDQLQKFSIGIVDEPNLRVQGDEYSRINNREYMLQINAVDPTDYIAMYRKYSDEEKARKELGEDLYRVFYDGGESITAKVDLYKKTNKNTFLLQYTEEDLIEVVKYIHGQKDKDETLATNSR